MVYFSGLTMNMTVPAVYKHIGPTDGVYRVNMKFYLAVDNPPQPIPPFATLITVPAGTQYYVR